MKARRPLWLVMAVLAGTGCKADKGGSTGDDTGYSAEVGCPDAVPEQFRDLWDCTKESDACSEGTQVYKYATGSSDASGNLTIEEQWFMFRGLNGDGTLDWCTDTWEIRGTAVDESKFTVLPYDCSTCEEGYDATWTDTTGNNCSLVWGTVFMDPDVKTVDGPFDGVLMMDTLNEINDEPMPNASIVARFLNGNTVYYSNSYTQGATVTPTSDVQGPPEDYEWTGAACWD